MSIKFQLRRNLSPYPQSSAGEHKTCSRIMLDHQHGGPGWSPAVRSQLTNTRGSKGPASPQAAKQPSRRTGSPAQSGPAGRSSSAPRRAPSAAASPGSSKKDPAPLRVPSSPVSPDAATRRSPAASSTTGPNSGGSRSSSRRSRRTTNNNGQSSRLAGVAGAVVSSKKMSLKQVNDMVAKNAELESKERAMTARSAKLEQQLLTIQLQVTRQQAEMRISAEKDRRQREGSRSKTPQAASASAGSSGSRTDRRGRGRVAGASSTTVDGRAEKLRDRRKQEAYWGHGFFARPKEAKAKDKALEEWLSNAGVQDGIHAGQGSKREEAAQRRAAGSSGYGQASGSAASCGGGATAEPSAAGPPAKWHSQKSAVLSSSSGAPAVRSATAGSQSWASDKAKLDGDKRQATEQAAALQEAGEQEAAAIAIQRSVRGSQARVKVVRKQESVSATRIQAIHRGRKGRAAASEARQKLEEKVSEEAKLGRIKQKKSGGGKNRLA